MFGVLPEAEVDELIEEFARRGYDADEAMVVMSVAPYPQLDDEGMVVIRSGDGQELGREDLSTSRAWRRACR